MFRLPRGFFEPWKTAVLVPEKSMVEPPFPFPLPPDAILLAAEESYRTWPTGHGLVREKVPGQVFFSFLSKAPPTEVMAFYRRAMEAAGAKTRGDTRLVVTFARTPDWAPRALKAMAVEEAEICMCLRASALERAPTPPCSPPSHVQAQIKSLRNVPSEVRRYSAGMTFVAVKPESNQ